MATYPKELIFRARQDIDQFLSEPGLNSALYDALLSVREPAQFRYALKVAPLEIFNEAYGQALRVLLDKHPEEDYYHNYQLNAKKYFQRTYEAELVFCLVYVLLFFSRIDTPNVKRFMEEIRRRMEKDQAYFPTFSKFVEDVCSDPFYDPDKDRFYLHTDAITKEELFSIRWELATNNYDEPTIWSYLRVAPDLDYQLAIMKQIRESYELDNAFSNYTLEDKSPLFDRIEKMCKSRPKTPTPLPVIEVVGLEDDDQLETEDDGALADIRIEAQQNEIASLKEQLAQKEAAIQSRDEKIAELKGEIDENNRELEHQANDIYWLNQEIDDLKNKKDDEAQDDPLDVPDKRTQRIVTLYLYEILKKAGMGSKSEPFNITDVAELIHYFTAFSYNTVRTSLHSGTVPSKSKKEVREVAKILKKLNLSVSIE